MQRKPVILASLLLAAFAINVETTIVNVALPTLVRELHASTTQLEWIVDAYNLVFAALVLAAGNLGDRVGRKGVLLAGAGDRTLGSDHRRRDRPGPHRRRLVARARWLAERLLRPGPDRRPRPDPGQRLRPQLAGSRCTSRRPPRPSPFNGGHGDSDLHDHRGPEPRLGRGPQHRRPRGRHPAARCLHRPGAA